MTPRPLVGRSARRGRLLQPTMRFVERVKPTEAPPHLVPACCVPCHCRPQHTTAHHAWAATVCRMIAAGVSATSCRRCGRRPRGLTRDYGPPWRADGRRHEDAEDDRDAAHHPFHRRVRDPRQEARDAGRGPRHFLVRASPHMIHATGARAPLLAATAMTGDQRRGSPLA